ncbi:MAG: cytochrome B [Desulfobacterales bacterium]|nr:cytochrome B [Desulfobacterales bacterium]
MENDKLMYIHPAPVRVWHWVNAVGFIILILTGFQIRFAEMIDLFSLEEAIQVHNYVGFVVIAAYGLWVSYYFGTMKIKLYFPNPRTFVPDAIKQLKYYGSGIFKGDPNPHTMTPDNKFNALQKKAYVGIMFVFLPAQMITGLFLWRVKGFENYIDLLGGVKIVSTIHVLLFFFFTAFIFVHFYLSTLGHTPLAHLKAMFTGYEEHHEPPPSEEAAS